MSNFKVIEVRPEKGISIRETVPSSEIGTKMGEMYGRVMEYTITKGLRVAGPPFALYHDYDQEKTDMECGFPVSGSNEGAGSFRSCTLPGGKVVKGVHVGPYDKLVDTYIDMQAWMGKEGLRPKKTMWERYLTDPKAEKNPSKYVTEIYWPVE
jgi:effector-binding domain-containing protein